MHEDKNGGHVFESNFFPFCQYGEGWHIYFYEISHCLMLDLLVVWLCLASWIIERCRVMQCTHVLEP
jgi:hypothetical protein